MSEPDFDLIINRLGQGARFASSESMQVTATQLLEAGCTPEEVASTLDIDLGIVLQFMGRRGVRDAMRQGQRGRATALSQRMGRLAAIAMETAETLLASAQTPADVKARLIADILDRATGKPQAGAGGLGGGEDERQPGVTFGMVVNVGAAGGNGPPPGAGDGRNADGTLLPFRDRLAQVVSRAAGVPRLSEDLAVPGTDEDRLPRVVDTTWRAGVSDGGPQGPATESAAAPPNGEALDGRPAPRPAPGRPSGGAPGPAAASTGETSGGEDPELDFIDMRFDVVEGQGFGSRPGGPRRAPPRPGRFRSNEDPEDDEDEDSEG